MGEKKEGPKGWGKWQYIKFLVGVGWLGGRTYVKKQYGLEGS